MLTLPKVIFTDKDNFEHSISQLFPKHNTFFCLDTDDCNILKYKKDSKYNILNWSSKIDWPNEHGNEFLSYEIYNDSYMDFIVRCDHEFSKGFLYANLILYSNNKTPSFESILTKIFSVCNIPVLIIYSSEVKFSNTLCNKINKWSIQNYLIVNTHNRQVMNVLTNYEVKETIIGSAGDNASDQQRISRKSSRWQSGLCKLPSKEQDFIIMNLIDEYIKGR